MNINILHLCTVRRYKRNRPLAGDVSVFLKLSQINWYTLENNVHTIMFCFGIKLLRRSHAQFCSRFYQWPNVLLPTPSYIRFIPKACGCILHELKTTKLKEDNKTKYNFNDKTVDVDFFCHPSKKSPNCSYVRTMSSMDTRMHNIKEYGWHVVGKWPRTNFL